MTHAAQAVIITRCWQFPADKSYPKTNESLITCHIAAVLYGRGAIGFISNSIAKKLLGANRTQSSCVVEISWAPFGCQQKENLETSQVQVVPELQQDIVLGDSTEELLQSIHITSPQDQVPSATCFAQSLSHQFRTQQDFERHGVVPVNQQSQDKFRHLLSLYQQKAQPPHLQDTSDSGPKKVEKALQSNSEILLSSTSDATSYVGSDENWVMALGGGSRPSMSSPRLAYLNSSAGTSKQDAWEVPTEEMSSNPNAHSPTSGWSLVEGHSSTTPEEVEEHQEVNEPRLDDFEMHPGHQFWEWDSQRQQWRRRGRTGLDERDWFTDTLSQ
ncbi:hypothetical protein FHETE_533 [Fusarium heterosporum]|uniref:Uncharacterized protein n=1 Tax=Fusarium heterosporum TaxID=42747 RepID=A0A8H5U0T7_FUSHE|nr:hypothetical protein FHETE_533 [Fusarium heterosporum]